MNRNTSIAKLWTWFVILALGISIAACSSREERAQAHYQSGQQLLKDGEFLKAGLEFRNALQYNEKLSEAWFALASVEEKNLNWPAVASNLQRVVELDPKNVEALIKLAKLQLAALQLEQALKNVNAADALKKDDTDVYALRAAILFRLNDRDGAKVAAERALALNPDNPDAHAALAADEMANGNTTAALRFIDRGLVKDPDNIGLLLFKVKIFEDTKDDPKLEAVLRQIIAANPEIKEIRQALLLFLTSRNRFADVESEMRAMVLAEPSNTAQAIDLVRVVGTTKGAAAARKELDTLIAAKPDVMDYRLALAEMDFAEKRTDAATAAVTAIVAKGVPTADVQRAKLLLTDMKIQLGQVDEAKSLLSEILAGDAKNADALTMQAKLRLQNGEVDGAVADLREALNQRPKSVPIMLLLGRAHERQGAVDVANDRLNEALKASNYNPQITLDYVAFLSRRGRSSEIEAILNAAVTRNPADARLLTALAQVRLNNQDWVGAQAIADALKKAGDQSGIGIQIQGALQLGQKKYDESIATLKEAYTAQQSEQPMHTLVLAYLHAGKVGEAESFVQSVLTANEKNAEALVLLGSIKGLQKKPQEAEAAYNLAVERQPTNPVGYIALSKFYFASNKPAEAEAALRRGLVRVPGDLSLNLGLSDLLQLRNDMEGAIAIYEEQIKTSPDALVIINNLASLLADFRSDDASLERAHQLAKRLESIDVDQFKDTVGWVAYRKGDFRTALLNLEAAAEKLPNLALVKYHLAMTYAALKRVADAKAQFAKADALLQADNPLKEKIRTAGASLDASN